MHPLKLFHILFSVLGEDAVTFHRLDTLKALDGAEPGSFDICGAVAMRLGRTVAPGEDGSCACVVDRLGSLDDLLFPAAGCAVALDPDVMVLAVLIRLFEAELRGVVVIFIGANVLAGAEPVGVGANVIDIGHGADGIDIEVKKLFLFGLLFHTGKLVRHKANDVRHTERFCILGNEVMELYYNVISEFGDVLIHNGGHLLAEFILKKLAAGGTGAGGVVIVGAGNLHFGDPGLIPEEGFAAELCNLIYPILNELTICG